MDNRELNEFLRNSSCISEDSELIVSELKTVKVELSKAEAELESINKALSIVPDLQEEITKLASTLRLGLPLYSVSSSKDDITRTVNEDVLSDLIVRRDSLSKIIEIAELEMKNG